jgi:hypothetical protein
MKAYKLYAAPILTLIGGVVALVLLASSMGSSVEQRARSLADRAFGEAQNNWQNQAQDILVEASDLARSAELPPPEEGGDSLRWRIDGTGKLIEGYGAGFEASEPDLSGMNVVARALQGMGSDAVVFLSAGEKGKWWHLAAAPSGKDGFVDGLTVVGRPLALVAKSIGEQMAVLAAGSGMPVHSVLYDGRRILHGKSFDSLTSMLKPGKVDGSVKGLGQTSLSLGIPGGASRLVAGNVIVTEGGRLVLASVVDARKAYRGVADLVKTSLGVLSLLFVLGLLLIFLEGRRQSRAGDTLITWLHTWRSSGAGAPVESLGLPGMFERIARNVDLTLAGAVGETPRAVSDPVGGSFDAASMDDDSSADFEQFSASAVFDSVEGNTQTSSAGAVSLFDGLEDTQTKLGDLPPLPTDLPAPPLPSAVPVPALTPPPGDLPPIPGGALIGKEIGSDAAIAPADPGGMFEDAPTGQFEVPDSLLQQITEEGGHTDSTSTDPERLLFGEYFELRERLGEDVEGLTFERFKRKIETTRARIMEETGARDVRFTVREKNGSASLRALPIND